MKRTTKVLGLLGLVLLGTACSGVGDEPPPFASATDLGSRLATDLGCPAYIVTSGDQLFVAVQGESRVIAPPNERGVGDAVKAWASHYATDFFTAPEALRVVGEGRDAGSTFRVTLSSGAPDNVDAFGYGIDLTLDNQGRLLGVIAHKTAIADFTPTVTELQAIRAAEAALHTDAPPDDTDLEPAPPPSRPTAHLVLMTVPGDDEPLLAYRIDVGAKSAWIDARSATVLSASTGLQALRADAKGWKSYSTIKFDDADKRRRVDYETTPQGVALLRAYEPATLTQKSKSIIVASSLRTIDPTSGAFIGEPIVASSTEGFDIGLGSKAANKAPAIANGLAVDAVAEIAHGERYFQTHLGSPSRRLKMVSGLPVLTDEPIEVILHANHRTLRSFRNPGSTGDFRNNAAFVNGTTQIIVGDGDAALLHAGIQYATVDRSAALATDVMAHELTHMWIDGKPPAGEARSIHEGISDVVGQFVEHEVAALFGAPSHPARFGESASKFSHGERFLAHPERGVFDAEHSWSRDCLLRDRGTSRLSLDARGQPKLDPVAHNDTERGSICDHANATVVGHAFYLMTFGGKNVRSKMVVRNPIGWEASQALWLSLLIKVPTPQGFRTLVPPTLLDLAQQQLAGARVHSVGVANAVGCAWEAVGVLDLGTTAKVTGKVCTFAAPIDCSRRPDGIYCDELQDFSATRCQGGSIAASPAPCGSKEVCEPRGGVITNQAETGGASTISCYDPKGELP